MFKDVWDLIGKLHLRLGKQVEQASSRTQEWTPEDKNPLTRVLHHHKVELAGDRLCWLAVKGDTCFAIHQATWASV